MWVWIRALTCAQASRLDIFTVANSTLCISHCALSWRHAHLFCTDNSSSYTLLHPCAYIFLIQLLTLPCEHSCLSSVHFSFFFYCISFYCCGRLVVLTTWCPVRQVHHVKLFRNNVNCIHCHTHAQAHFSYADAHTHTQYTFSLTLFPFSGSFASVLRPQGRLTFHFGSSSIPCDHSHAASPPLKVSVVVFQNPNKNTPCNAVLCAFRRQVALCFACVCVREREGDRK